METTTTHDKNNIIEDQENHPIGSYAAMKPWFDEVDRLHEEFLRLEREGLLEDKNED